MKKTEKIVTDIITQIIGSGIFTGKLIDYSSEAINKIITVNF